MAFPKNYSIRLLCPRPLPQTAITCQFSSNFDSQIANEKLEEQIQSAWKLKLQQYPTLFNASKFRLGYVEISSNFNSLHFGIGLTDYARFLGTNRNLDENVIEQLKLEGKDRFDDEFALFASPLGNAALIFTTDGLIPMFQRSFLTSEFAGWWDIPGGHPEPDRVFGTQKRKTDMDERSSTHVVENEIVKELCFSVRDEIRAELNLQFEHIGQPLLIGIVEAHISYGKPSAIL
jgi:hypothetical protein